MGQASGVRRARWAASMRSFLLTPDTSHLTPGGWKIGRQRVRFFEPADSRPGHVTGASSALPSPVVYACKLHASTVRVSTGQLAVGSEKGTWLRTESRYWLPSLGYGQYDNRIPATAHCPLPTPHYPSPALSCLIDALYAGCYSYTLVSGVQVNGLFVRWFHPRTKLAYNYQPIEGAGGSWGAGMQSVGPTVSCELAPSGQDTSIQGRAGVYTSLLAMPLRPGLRSRQARALAIVSGTPGGFDQRQVPGVRCQDLAASLWTLAASPS